MLPTALYALLILSPLIVSASPQAAATTYKVSYNVNPYPARVDVNAKYWPPGEGPPSKRWLDEIAAEYYQNRNMTSDEGRCPRKMSDDESEKFYDHYWNWRGEESSGQDIIRGSFGDIKRSEEDAKSHLRRSDDKTSLQYRAPSRRHGQRSISPLAIFARAASFQCAPGTTSCLAIERPEVCCNNDQTCTKIEDTGFGDVGCCQTGESCTGELKGCNDDTQVTCTSKQGGGCCNKGSVCSPNGCVPAAASTTGPASTCTAGSYSCPSNVAGGCCPSGRLCGVSDCPAPTSTATATISGNTCPTGFYTCAGSFNGGCCRIGRDCGITDCPPRGSGTTAGGTTTITAGGGGGVVTNAGCAIGWSACANNVGGGCCPSGYDCGQTNCPAKTLQALQTVGGAVVTATTTLPVTSKMDQATIVAAAPRGRSVEGVAAVLVGIAGVLVAL